MGSINVKSILDIYQILLLDEDTVNNFAADIYERIDKYRIKTVSSDDTENDQYNPVINESYCHAFYRILGLPVVSPNLNDFYNTGYFSNLHDYNKSQKEINNNQGNLYSLEKQRELNCSKNLSTFLSQSESALEYKINMLQFPKKVNILKDLSNEDNCYAKDEQIEKIKERTTKFQTVQHILRPFRCNAYIAPIDRVLVPKKNLSAPFYVPIVDPQIEKYDTTYLETVCKIRFSPAISSENEVKSLDNLNLALKSIQEAGLTIFNNVIGKQSIIELYTLTNLMNNFIHMCVDYASKTKEYKNLASRYDAINNENTRLSADITLLEELKLQYESIQTFIPSDINNVNGIDVQTLNVDTGVLTPNLISIINSPVVKVGHMLDEKNNEKNKHVGELNKLSSNMFYLTGEVYGIGVLEMMAMMISFWTISQESLLSMLDSPAFERLYKNNPTLRNDIVLARQSKNDRSPHKKIVEVMMEFDSSVYNLLALADSIITHCMSSPNN